MRLAVRPRSQQPQSAPATTFPWGFALRVSLVPLLLAAFTFVPPGASNVWLWSMLAVFYWLLGSALLRPQYVRPNLPTFATAESLFLAFSFLLFYLPYQQLVLIIGNFFQTL